MFRSAEWGTMPLHWYFTSVLPRTLLAGLPLAALGMALERRVHHITSCVLLYIAVYSLLPHKEVKDAQYTPCFMHSSIVHLTTQSSVPWPKLSHKLAVSMLGLCGNAGMQ